MNTDKKMRKEMTGTVFSCRGRASKLRFSLSVLSVFIGVHLWLIPPTQAQTSYPMITHTTPVAVQRGKTTEVVVEGQMNFHGVYKALFEGTGITAEVLPTPLPKGAP